MVKPLKTFFCINVDIQPANDVIKLFSCTTCVEYEGEGGVGGREAGGRRYMDKVMICFHFLWGPFPNLNHVVKLGIIRTNVGQTFPICLTFHYNNVKYS